MAGVCVVQSSHLLTYRYLKFHLCLGCYKFLGHLLSYEKKWKREKETEQNSTISLPVKDVSITFVGKKIKYVLQPLKVPGTQWKHVCPHMLTLFFISDHPMFISILVSWHCFTRRCTLLLRHTEKFHFKQPFGE